MTPNQPPGAVVVGVDGSDHADLAVRAAALLAAPESRPLHVVHAPERIAGTLPHELAAPAPEDPGPGVPDDPLEVVERARTTALAVSPGLVVSSEVVIDDPRRVLERASSTADAVVVGSRGLGPVGSLLLGSVGRHLARHSRCPVVVVRPEQGPEDHARILVGTDGTGASAAAMAFAFARASRLGVPLTVVHCVDFPDGLGGVTDGDLEGLLVGRQAVAASIAGMRDQYPDLDVDFELGQGPVADYLVAASDDAGMLVVGAGRHPGATHWPVDHVARDVVEHAHSTVAIVPAAS